ncbi:hypothetical protein Vadar_017561 [Vaccinium darrowii]|uniref:Uncharacterized protein n=1 Tax=Vaccinium darrowii TaxID=229202 RepID=A0ACB7XZP9_9ERIC|nr:hypothetical protein Vadar_017561 [Vaccinium darrowii]
MSKIFLMGEQGDPYVTIAVSGSVIGRTFVISNSENPVWKQHFCVLVAHSAAEVHFVVKNNEAVGSRIIRVVGIPVEQLWSATKIDGTFPIIKETGKPWEIGAVLSVSIQYIPMGKMTLRNIGVPGTYFPLRKGGKVMLYQDAHVHDGFLPNLRLDHDMQYKHGNCWRDIFDAICQARDLLKTKSKEGVRVLLLVWDDPTSLNFLVVSRVVYILLFSVNGKLSGEFLRSILSPSKSVHGIRAWKITFFHAEQLGLSSTTLVDNVRFSGDFVRASVVGCPREPCHDLHCRIDGPTAYDILTNFEERWSSASKPRTHEKLKMSGGDALQKISKIRGITELKALNPKRLLETYKSYDDELHDDALLSIDSIPEIIRMTDLPCLTDDDPEAWHVQIYGYRMSLWAEHIGDLEECFNQPESIGCTRRVRTLGELNWKQFVANEVTEMKDHLLKYPLEVDRMGKVNPLPGCKEFPDMGGKVTGSTGPGLIDLDKNVTI